MNKQLSIITLTYNKLEEATRPFLQSLYACTSQDSFELILIDNGSTDGTVEFLKNFETQNDNVRVIYNTENLGYSKGCNQGAKIAQNEYIAFLNNDILLSQGWTDNLLEIFEIEPDAGLVSAYQIEGEEYNIWIYPEVMKKMFKKRSCDNKPSIKPNFSCVMTRKNIFDKIGGFDENFTPAYFEDNDLSWRYIFSGYKNFISQKSYIYHKGSLTGKSLANLNQIYERNRDYFFQKYADKYYVMCDWFLGDGLNRYKHKVIKYKKRNLFYKLKQNLKVCLIRLKLQEGNRND